MLARYESKGRAHLNDANGRYDLLPSKFSGSVQPMTPVIATPPLFILRSFYVLSAAAATLINQMMVALEAPYETKASQWQDPDAHPVV